MPGSIAEPLVHVDRGGITLLTGANVDLAPAYMDALRARSAGPAGTRGGDLDLLAFARTRSGVVGCRGIVTRDGEGMRVRGIEAFGPQSAIPGFGRALGALLSFRERFSDAPAVERPPGDGTSAHLLADAMVAGGLADGSVRVPPLARR